MNKEQQIEEITRKMQKCYEKNGLLNFKWFAEALYEAGYQKVPENERFEKNVLEIEKKNAVKEFARKVKHCSYCDNVFMDGKWHRYVFVDDIDELLKE